MPSPARAYFGYRPHSQGQLYAHRNSVELFKQKIKDIKGRSPVQSYIQNIIIVIQLLLLLYLHIQLYTLSPAHPVLRPPSITGTHPNSCKFQLCSLIRKSITMKSIILSVPKLASLALFAICFGSLSLAEPTVGKLAMEKRALPVLMGLAKSFGALSATTLTSTGATAITGAGGVGNGGVWPGTAISGFPPGTASGVLAPGTVFAQNGEAGCLTAYNKYVSSFHKRTTTDSGIALDQSHLLLHYHHQILEESPCFRAYTLSQHQQ
jgi:hypothetical protein